MLTTEEQLEAMEGRWKHGKLYELFDKDSTAVNEFGYTLDHVRRIATCHDYQEISHNETSRVVSFRKGPTRINVYYTTGTVATCLNHPKRGKTQLFRRNVALDDLDKIFENPRTHTGKGYYTRDTVKKLWRKDNDERLFEWDSALRWKYVAAATGLANNRAEMDAIADVCSSWDSLCWDEGDPPDLNNTQFACGSTAALMKMLLLDVGPGVGVATCVPAEEFFKFEEGGIPKSDLHTSLPLCHYCDNEMYFRVCYQCDLDRLKEKFLVLDKWIRIELVKWFVGREACGYMPIDKHYESLYTPFSFAVEDAHREYGELMYPKKTKICKFHGVLLSDDGYNPHR